MSCSIAMASIEDRLPFDLWVIIASHLPVLGIVNLTLTCTYFRDVMNDRAVWSLVLQDLVDVMPYHVVRRTLSLMPTLELRRRAIRALRINNILHQDICLPAKVHIEEKHLTAAKAVLAPGGDWMMILYEDGSIHLHRSRNLSETPQLVINRPDSSPSHHWNSTDMNNNIIISSAGENYLMLASESFHGLDGQKFAQFRVYYLDFASAGSLSPSIRHLTTLTRPDIYCDSGFKGGLLGTSWEEGGQYLLSIRKIPLFADDIEKEIIMNLGEDMAEKQPMLKIICPHLVVLSTPQQFFLFAIPELEPIVEHKLASRAFATPFATYGLDKHDDVWNRLCCNQEGRLAVATAAELDFSVSDDMFLVIWPPAGQPEDKFIRHRLWQFDMNPSRGIFVKHYHFSGSIELNICTHFSKHDDHPGYMRLGTSEAPDPSRVVNIPLDGQSGYIKDLSWDEESGRICVLIWSPDQDEVSDRRLLIVDLLE